MHQQEQFMGIKMHCKDILILWVDHSMNSLKRLNKNKKNNISWKQRKLYEYLITYRNHVYKKYLVGTADLKFKYLTIFYKACEIEIGDLDFFSRKNVNFPEPVDFDDLLTLDELKIAIQLSPPIMRAIILFMLSSACAKTDTLDFQIIDFIKATEMYHNIDFYIEKDKNEEKKIILAVINALLEKMKMIPIFKDRRDKTSRFFLTFCSPE